MLWNDAITAGIPARRNGVRPSFCVATILRTECPLWVKSGHRGTSNQCLLYPQKPDVGTQSRNPLCANSGHSALRQGTSLFDHLVSALLELERNVDADCLCGLDAANSDRRCPLWVKSGHCAVSGRCPLYPQKQTLLSA